MKIAVVTGASSGLGREYIRQIAARYCGIDEIWGIARRGDRLENIKAELEDYDVKFRSIVGDLTNEDTLIELKNLLNELKPKVKILINAAGFGIIGEFANIDSDYSRGMIELNCKALCDVTYEVLPFMCRNSRIMQIASSAAFMPQPKFAVYAASKAFVLNFSDALGVELRKREIYVTSVCPGPVKTEFFDIAQKYAHVSLYKRLAMAEANLVVRQSLEDMEKKKRISIYGGLMKLFYISAKVFPRELFFKFIR